METVPILIEQIEEDGVHEYARDLDRGRIARHHGSIRLRDRPGAARADGQDAVRPEVQRRRQGSGKANAPVSEPVLPDLHGGKHEGERGRSHDVLDGQRRQPGAAVGALPFTHPWPCTQRTDCPVE